MSLSLPSNYTDKAEASQNKPIELYDFVLDGQTLKFANYQSDVSFFDIDGNAATYTALALQREKIAQHMDNQVDNVVVRVDNVNQAMASYIANNEFRGRRLVIRLVFSDLLGDATYAKRLFDGIMDVPIIGYTSVQVQAVSRLGFLRKVCPNRRFDLLCEWRFAGAECAANGMSAATLKDSKSGTVDSGSTTTVIQDAERSEGTGYWTPGIIEFTGGTASLIGLKRRVIANTSGGAITVDVSLPTAPSSGDTYTIERDCDKTLNNCTDRFSNTANYGGFNTLPQEMEI